MSSKSYAVSAWLPRSRSRGIQTNWNEHANEIWAESLTFLFTRPEWTLQLSPKPQVVHSFRLAGMLQESVSNIDRIQEFAKTKLHVDSNQPMVWAPVTVPILRRSETASTVRECFASDAHPSCVAELNGRPHSTDSGWPQRYWPHGVMGAGGSEWRALQGYDGLDCSVARRNPL